MNELVPLLSGYCNSVLTSSSRSIKLLGLKLFYIKMQTKQSLLVLFFMLLHVMLALFKQLAAISSEYASLLSFLF